MSQKKIKKFRPVRIAKWMILWLVIIGVGLLLLNWACCSDFSKKWKEGLSDTHEESQRDLIVGRWVGTWQSETGKGDGSLKCKIISTGDDKYDASFEAVFWGVFKFDAEVELTVTKGKDRWEFTGQKDLGFLQGGVYTYEGYSDGKEFYCTYTADVDHGYYRLNRLEDDEKEHE